jgi:hypothetical protein
MESHVNNNALMWLYINLNALHCAINGERSDDGRSDERSDERRHDERRSDGDDEKRLLSDGRGAFC